MARESEDFRPILERLDAALPDCYRYKLAQAVLDSLERAMAEPGAEEAFQAWLAERKRAQALS